MKIRILLTSLLMAIISHAALAVPQLHDYVTFVIENLSGEVEQLIHYPAGTTYKVFLTKKEEETCRAESVVVYSGDFKLTVYPFYRKSQPEHLTFFNKRLRIFMTGKAAVNAGFGDVSQEENYTIIPAKKPSTHDANGMTAEKVITSSQTDPNAYNVTLFFSDGTVFEYTDGKTKAFKNDINLTIRGNYLVSTEQGLFKISFDSSDGELWWVYGVH